VDTGRHRFTGCAGGLDQGGPELHRIRRFEGSCPAGFGRSADIRKPGKNPARNLAEKPQMKPF
jgi:hypothetical protein